MAVNINEVPQTPDHGIGWCCECEESTTVVTIATTVVTIAHSQNSCGGFVTVICEHLVCPPQMAPMSNGSCDICQGNQESNSKYNVQEPVVGQGLHVQHNMGQPGT